MKQTETKYRLSKELAANIRTNPPVNMNVMEAAAYTGISPRKMRDMIRYRDIRSVRLGKRIIVRREWLDEFLTREQA